MKRVVLSVMIVAGLALGLSFFAQHITAAEATSAPPKDRVVAMYFHRTQRCPTCLKMGSYTEEAVKTGFASQLKGGTVEFHYIDFQKKENAAFTKAYQVTGPALIVAKVVNNKVAEVKNLKDIWTHVGDKMVFLKYVQDNVTAYQAAAK
ncbi:MAG: nitrophenyl compound nitroreductase subunit ArsF family protein [Thermoguttaceae bacterium]